MSFSPFDKPHTLTVTLSADDWKKLKRASISQRQSLTKFVNDAVHEACKHLDRFGRSL